MDDHIYKKIEIVGTSQVSIEDAVNKAIGRAAKTLHKMRWFEVVETRGHIDGDSVSYWQVTLKIGFTLDD